MKNWKVELTTGGKSLAEEKIQRGIFQGNAFSSLLFIITMMPLNYILRKCTGANHFTKTQEKINYLMYMDDIKLLAKKKKIWKRIGNYDTINKNIQPGYREGIWFKNVLCLL